MAIAGTLAYVRAMTRPPALFDADLLARRRARAAAAYADRFPADGGRVRASFEVIFLTGWAPAPDQPRPLRPGSAAARLADALGAVERQAGEPATPHGRGKP